MTAKIVLLLFMLIGASFCILAFYLWYRNNRLASIGIYATGHVLRWVEIECHSDIGQGAIVMYAPVVKFTAIDARTIEFTDPFLCRDSGRYKIGQEVKVQYDRWECSHAWIDTGVTRNGGPVFVLIMGLVFLLFGYVGHVVDIRH